MLYAYNELCLTNQPIIWRIGQSSVGKGLANYMAINAAATVKEEICKICNLVATQWTENAVEKPVEED